MFSLAIFLEPMSTATGWSRAGISSAMTLNFLTMGLGAFGCGAVSDRYGTRIVVLIGAVLLGLALSLASHDHLSHRGAASRTTIAHCTVATIGPAGSSAAECLRTEPPIPTYGAQRRIP